MKKEEIEREISRLRNRREEALPPSVKHQVQASQELTLSSLEIALQGALLVEAVQTLTQELSGALKASGREIEALRKVINSFGVVPMQSSGSS